MRRTAGVLAICLTGLLAGCNPVLPEKHFDDTLLYHVSKPTYEVALGMKTIYCLSGKYQDLKPGIAVEMGTRTPHIFPIAEVLGAYPELASDTAKQASRTQQVEFKRHKSPLYNPVYDEVQRPTDNKARVQQEVPSARRLRCVVPGAADKDNSRTLERIGSPSELY